jgi:hypothetical protein
MRKANLYAAAAAVAAFAASAPPAHALLTLSADISGTAFTCQDQQATCDTDPVVGQLALDETTVGGVVVTGSFSRSLTNPFNLLASSSTSVINQSGETRKIIVAVGDINFVGPASSIETTGSGTFVNNEGGSITLNYFVDNANTQGADDPNDTPGANVDTFNFTPNPGLVVHPLSP